MTDDRDDAQDHVERWRGLSGIPVEAPFLHAYRSAGAARELGYPLTSGVFLDDTLLQYFTHGRLEAPGRSTPWPVGVPRHSNLGENLARALAGAEAAPDAPGDFEAALQTPELRARAGAGVGAPITWRGAPTQLFQRQVVRLMPVSPGTRRPVRGNLGELYVGLTVDERARGEGEPSPIDRPVVAAPEPVVAPVLTYHHTRGADAFRDHLTALLNEGLEPVSFDQLIAGIEGWATLPPRAFALTFDDGWLGQYHDALPVLLELRVPATFFVLPGFDRHGQGHMTIDQMREVRAAGMTVGSHTLNHARLPSLIRQNLGAAQAEVVLSRADLERDVDGVDYFAYPNGLYDDDVIQLVRDSGYRAAVTTVSGMVHSLDRRFELRRVAANAWGSLAATRRAIRQAAANDGVESPI
ncbi:MAG: polysaccharide deacetylase family protein [Chloroflexi bacterium]|nr:polysaccharide deacetylase family protein [Chloroflexota bacterium]